MITKDTAEQAIKAIKEAFLAQKMTKMAAVVCVRAVSVMDLKAAYDTVVGWVDLEERVNSVLHKLNMVDWEDPEGEDLADFVICYVRKNMDDFIYEYKLRG